MPIPRSVILERLTYAAAAPVLAAAPNIDPNSALNTVVLLSGAAGTAWAYLAAKDISDAAKKIMRASPLFTGLAVDVAATITPGWGWDALIAAAWAAAGATVLPLSRLSRRHRPAIAATPAPVLALATPAVAMPDPYASTLTQQTRMMWERAGNPGSTIIVKARRHEGTPHDLTLLLRAAEPGRPITGITRAAVAAAFDVFEADVRFSEVLQQNGRQGGPGWLEAHVIPDANERRRKQPTDTERWHDKIGNEAGAIPGSTFVERIRDKERGVTLWLARMTDPDTDPQIDLKKLGKALDASYDDGRVFCDVEGTNILVSVWDKSPLARVYPATRELLTPDKDGRWTVGYLTNGQPARNRVYTDRGAAHGLMVAPSGGGKTQLIALFVCADANYGATVWLAAETADEKTAVLGNHVDRQGFGALYMVRALHAALALMEIRAQMPWADGRVHDWDPKLTGCPYTPLSLYLDEFLSATRDEKHGAQIMNLAEQISVKGRKYGIGEKVAGQSVYVQDGFTQLLNGNLRENCIPIVLKPDPKKITELFKALGVTPENIPAPLPRSFAPAETGRLARIMNGEPEPPASSNTGGVGHTIEHVRPEVLRTLYMDFSQDIAPLFPSQIGHLTDHEIRELDKRGLWGDWNRPDDEADDLDDWGYENDPEPRRDAVTTPSEALAALKKLTHA